ncbi:MAG: 2-C-methyl-D-erythritol 4-phosphate cytidylyltransferase [Myxococcota bacterium]
MSVAALVLAAGSGQRLGLPLTKAFVPIGGKPLLLYSLETLASVQEIDCVVPIIAAADLDRFRALDLAGIPKLAAPVVGGAERQDSVAAGLAALSKAPFLDGREEVSLVAIHDAARPWVRSAAVSRVIAAARREGAAILAAPAADTIKRVREGRVIETPDRAECWTAQTPQVFRLPLLREALAKAEAAGRVATDDAQLVEWLGSTVAVVTGDSDNRKITFVEDLAAAERHLAAKPEETA